MAARKSQPGDFSKLGGGGYVTADDVSFLRRTVFPDGIVCRAEIDAIFALADRAPAGDPEWPAFFAEAAADFFLNEEEPRGYITDGDFAALKALVTRDSARMNALELGMLVRLMEKAVACPPGMSDFVAEQIRGTISSLKPRRIGAGEADLIRRFLYAAGGEGAIAITREEAELLFDLHDMTAGEDNDPAWCDLFIKGVAAHLMQYVGYRPLPREEALRLQAWAEDHSVSVGGFFNRMFSGGLSAVREAYGRKAPTGRRRDDDDIAIAIAEQVTAREADWLADRIGRNGTVDALEKAVLAYMKELEADLPPKLQALVAAA